MSSAGKHPAQEIVDTMNRIYRYGMGTTSGGNLSILDDDGNLWISPGGIDKGRLSPEDISCIRPDGTVTGKYAPSMELPFHRSVYRLRPDVRAVLHAHPPALVTFSSVRRVPDILLTHHAYSVCGRVGMAEYAIPGSEALGEKICDVLADGTDIVMLENHGVVVCGGSMREAFIRFEAFDMTARMEINASRLEKPQGIPITMQDEISAMLSAPRLESHLRIRKISASEQKLREELAYYTRRAYDQGLFMGSYGSFSARLGRDAWLLGQYGVDRHTVGPEDFVLIEEGGFYENGKAPSNTACMHVAIYENHPHIQAVAVAQPPALMAYALTGRNLDTHIIPESFMMLGDIVKLPIDCGFIRCEEVGEAITEATPAVIIQNFGLVTVGMSLVKAFDRVEVAEYTARALLACPPLGNTVQIPQQEIDAIDAMYNRAKH